MTQSYLRAACQSKNGLQEPPPSDRVNNCLQGYFAAVIRVANTFSGHGDNKRNLLETQKFFWDTTRGLGHFLIHIWLINIQGASFQSTSTLIGDKRQSIKATDMPLTALEASEADVSWGWNIIVDPQSPEILSNTWRKSYSECTQFFQIIL